MSQQRWQRFLPERSQFMLLTSVLVVIFAMVGFINLAIVKSAALAEQRAVQNQLDAAREQGRLLQKALDEAQSGQNLWIMVWKMFGLAPPGVTVVMPKPMPAPDEVVVQGRQAAGPPYWASWWERLVRP